MHSPMHITIDGQAETHIHSLSLIDSQLGARTQPSAAVMALARGRSHAGLSPLACMWDRIAYHLACESELEMARR